MTRLTMFREHGHRNSDLAYMYPDGSFDNPVTERVSRDQKVSVRCLRWSARTTTSVMKKLTTTMSSI